VTWFGPPPDAALHDVLAMAGDVVRRGGDDPRAALVASGIWTMGADAANGGGGAAQAEVAAVLTVVGGSWPDLAWESVVTSVAVDLLAGTPACADLVPALHEGQSGVAVVDAARVQASATGPAAVDRLDSSTAEPLVLLLGDSVRVVPAAAVTTRRLRSTGLAALPARCGELADHPGPVELTAGAAGARARLALGAAAVAAGLAGRATELATEYAGERHQFGGPIAAIPTVAAALRRCRETVACSVVRILGAVGADAGVAEAVRAAAVDDAIDVASTALQVHGGYGYLAEYDLERMVRDAISLRAATAVPFRPAAGVAA
jgi:alkylation response protein AidB-like acyl-CoA dehydrogenase